MAGGQERRFGHDGHKYRARNGEDVRSIGLRGPAATGRTSIPVYSVRPISSPRRPADGARLSHHG